MLIQVRALATGELKDSSLETIWGKSGTNSERREVEEQVFFGRWMEKRKQEVAREHTHQQQQQEKEYSIYTNLSGKLKK
jgi:hypothetical protein